MKSTARRNAKNSVVTGLTVMRSVWIAVLLTACPILTGLMRIGKRMMRRNGSKMRRG